MPIQRPPDTRRDVGLPTRGQRRSQTRDASAYATVNRVFNAILPFIGQDRAMPLVYFKDRRGGIDTQSGASSLAKAWPARAGHARARPEAPGTGAIPSQGSVVYPSGRDSLAGILGKWGTKSKQDAIDILLHEIAHTQQNPHLLNFSSTEGWNKDSRYFRMEAGADAFAMAARNRVAEILGMPAPDRYFGYEGWGSPAGRRFTKAYGRKYALRGQFQRG